MAKPPRKSSPTVHVTLNGVDLKSKEERPPVGRVERLRGSLFRPKVLVAVAALVVSTAAIPYVLSKVPPIEDRPEYQVKWDRIAVSTPPEWIPDTFLEDVRQREELPESFSLFDDGLNERLAFAFYRHPWVKQVKKVTKSFPAQVAIELEYRRPVAAVRVLRGLYPVDNEGVLLPTSDFSSAAAQALPRVEGIRSMPQTGAGAPWGDPGVTAAAQLAEHLSGQWDSLGLAAIVVPPRTSADWKTDDLCFALKSEGGSRILWGRPPTVEHPGELAASQKLGRIKQYLDDFGGFDSPHGPYEIDIRHWQEITRHPLSESRMSSRGDDHR